MTIRIQFHDNDKQKYYEIRPHYCSRVDTWWLTTEEGEGMVIEAKEFYKILDAYFQENM
jgi:hypothetical protein